MSSKTVPAIVIQQPWPWAIFHAPDRKRHENRGRNSSHRGPLVIVAGKGRSYLSGIDWLRKQGQPCPTAGELPFGCAVGVVEMVDCLDPLAVAEAIKAQVPGCRYLCGPFAHVYRNACAFKTPVPASGNQAVPFRLPLTDELIAQLELVPTHAARRLLETA